MSTTNLPSLARLGTQDLLGHLSRGDEGAWAVLYARYRVYLLLAVREHLRRDVRPVSDAEDILQSAFVSAWGHIRGFEYRGEGSFRRWLRRIVSNKVRDRLRRGDLPLEAARSQELLDQLPSSADQPSGLASRAEETARLLQMLERLPEAEREVVVMREFEGSTWAEIAAVTKRSEAALRERYRKAWDRLTRLMGD